MKKFLGLTEGSGVDRFWAGSKRSEHRLCGRLCTERCYQGLWLFQSLIGTSLQRTLPPFRDSLSPYVGVLDWMSVYPQLHMLNPTLQCDGIRKWGSWEVMLSWVQGTREWDQCPHQRGPQEHSRHPSCEELNEKTAPIYEPRSRLFTRHNLPAPWPWISQPQALWEIRFCL